ncbi:hypothetical protein NCU16371 [Neurospora crassa OR74A]|uniref:Uncharacterized protein n=1 Tax=Neurospora crassa (strain ATCC 24698 / 74-OR23-1A / CBS 708.71 / DSM 1257 / FGSC 987) TaxID=367110 RepID=V5IQI0_NEUCR|nr:hypothetical protein NCU16371 [Neurospora crassa OR74A]ESA43950.1 hypothetical protein NCU16371 [Neurospora crassa OR74A]|eukprot:XP_011393365.1 hypothetical protein NCU16371 [Neurospora crassa OR74A]
MASFYLRPIGWMIGGGRAEQRLRRGGGAAGEITVVCTCSQTHTTPRLQKTAGKAWRAAVSQALLDRKQSWNYGHLLPLGGRLSARAPPHNPAHFFPFLPAVPRHSLSSQPLA